MADKPGVVSRAVRQAPGAERRPGLWQVGVGEHGEIGGLLRLDPVRDNVQGPRVERRLVTLGDCRRQGPERDQHRALRGGLFSHDLRGPDHLFGDVARLGKAGGDPSPGVGDLDVVEGGQSLQPPHPGLGVRPVVDDGGSRDIAGRVERAAVAGEGLAFLFEAEALELVPDDPVQERPVQPILLAEGRCPDRGKPAPDGAEPGLACGERCGRVIGPAAERRTIAFLAGPDRVDVALIAIEVGDHGLERRLRRGGVAGRCSDHGDGQSRARHGRPGGHSAARTLAKAEPGWARSSSAM